MPPYTIKPRCVRCNRPLAADAYDRGEWREIWAEGGLWVQGHEHVIPDCHEIATTREVRARCQAVARGEAA